MVPQAFSMVGLLRSNCRIAKAKGRRHPLTLAFLFLSLCFLTWLTYSILFRHADKCDVTNDLKPLLLIVHDTFVYKGVEYFSDGGTTLGYVRNKGILPNEHDLDVVIGEQDYERLVMLKPYFEAQGLFLYVRGDYIFQKAWTRFWEWKPYLDDYPCGRLYDQHKWYYVDIYCYEEVKGSELADKYPYFKDKIVVENPDDIYHCKERVDGGCQLASNNLPVSYMEIYGRQMPMPSKPVEVLISMYGPDYMITSFKGYKV